MAGRKALALIDGHHYLHVLKAALRHAEERLGYSIVGVILLGSPGKLGPAESLAQLEFPVILGTEDFPDCVVQACRKFEPDVVIDMSGEPLLNPRARLQIADAVLASGVSYAGPDFQFASRPEPDLPAAPTLALLGAGKLVGKTAVCAFAARQIARSGLRPVIVTMGRGGPVEPQLIRADETELTPEFLIAEVKRGQHAAGDNYEEALLTHLPTVGCFRAGGGLAGQPFCSTVEKGAELANSLDCDIQIYEGSGNTAPPVRLDARILVVGAAQPVSRFEEPFGAVGVRGADLVVVTGCEEPVSSTAHVRELVDALRTINPQAPVRTAVLRPHPLGNVEGKKVVLATTAPQVVLETLVTYLEQTHGCKVAAVTRTLSDRGRLREEMASILSGTEKPDVLLTELKAASIQVAAPMALNAGMEVVFCSNVPKEVEPEPGNLVEDVVTVAQLAAKRYRAKHAAGTGS